MATFPPIRRCRRSRSADIFCTASASSLRAAQGTAFRRLHLRTAEALEAGAGAAVEKYASEIGYHLYHAGSAADPVRTASLHGRRARDWALAVPEAQVSFGYAPNNLIVAQSDGHRQVDERLQRFSAALRDSIAEL